MTDPNASPVAPAGDTPPPARHGARLDRVLLDADPHAPAIVEARAVMEFRLDPRVEMLVRRAILGAPFGDRGCFHDGCAPTEAREEGGTHWCTMAPVARCAR